MADTELVQVTGASTPVVREASTLVASRVMATSWKIIVASILFVGVLAWAIATTVLYAEAAARPVPPPPAPVPTALPPPPPVPVFPADLLTIVHFNDVYEILGTGTVVNGVAPLGGGARAATVIDAALAKTRPGNAIVTLGGDFLSPSVMTPYFKGKQMVDVLNQLNMTAAVIGNHEFDQGLPAFFEAIAMAKFPILNANVLEKATGKLLNGTVASVTVPIPGFGLVGLVGVIYDFFAVIPAPTANLLSFVNPIEAVRNETTKLKAAGCNYVIAVTHQTTTQDCDLAKAATGVNMILGGHDHNAFLVLDCTVPYVKSTSDWTNIFTVDVNLTTKKAGYRMVDLDVNVPEKASVKSLVNGYNNQLAALLDVVVFTSTTVLDARTSQVRAFENALGSLGADVAKGDSEIGFINGGSVRSNTQYPAGPVTGRIINTIFPFANKVMKIRITGAQLRSAMVNSVSSVATLAGRFLHVSGFRYTWNTTSLGITSLVYQNGSAVQDTDSIVAGMTDFISGGGDGYTMFVGAPALNDAASAPLFNVATLDMVKMPGFVMPNITGRINRVA